MFNRILSAISLTRHVSPQSDGMHNLEAFKKEIICALQNYIEINFIDDKTRRLDSLLHAVFPRLLRILAVVEDMVAENLGKPFIIVHNVLQILFYTVCFKNIF